MASQSLPSHNGQVTISSLLVAAPKVILFPLQLAFEVLRSPFVPWNSHLPLSRVLSDAFVRYSTQLPPGICQAIVGSTERSYGMSIKQKDVEIVEENGITAKLLWIGDRDTKDVCLYLHGGGFVLPATTFQFGWTNWLHNTLGGSNRKLSFAILEYDLAPDATFPIQACQAMAALKHLLTSRSASNVHLMGDSAGGNLILQILSHSLHPIPGVPPYPISEEKLGSATLISPWVYITPDSGRRDLKTTKSDLVAWDNYDSWGAIFLNTVPGHQELHRAHIEAAKAPLDWFAGIESRVQRVFVTSGGLEALGPDIAYFVQTVLKPHFPNVVYLKEEKGKHIEPLLPFAMGRPSGGYLPDSTKLICSWYEEMIAPVSVHVHE